MGKNRKIIARANAGSTIGLGHLYRLVGLTEVFQHDTEIEFVLPNSNYISLIPKSYHFQVLPKEVLTKEDELNWLHEYYEPIDHIFFLDGYDLDKNYQCKLIEKGYKVLFVDDFVQFEQQAHVVINPSLNIRPEAYKKHPRTQFGLGSKYAALRKEFLAVAMKNDVAHPPEEIRSVFISLGGADPFNLSAKVIHALSAVAPSVSLHVLIGQANESPLKEEASQGKHYFYRNLTENQMIDLMQKCDAAITSASTICYEICCVRKPLAIGWYVDNQEKLYNGFLKEELARGLGNLKDILPEDLSNQLRVFLHADHQPALKRQVELFDGKNQIRLRKLLKPYLKKIELRRVEQEDVQLLFQWANDPLVRSQSLNPKPITFEEHEQWLQNKLADKNSLLFIGHQDEDAVGQIRFDQKEDHILLSYLVAEMYRGRGLGYELVARGLKALKLLVDQGEILAQVKLKNLASQKVFERLGFVKFECSDNREIIEYKISLGELSA
ncbi:MAG: UDP-2,4-diacetamido-2,4,6-trideoxy-beta-L-altropyranose hydrolase [Crocinitomicaceae bacterium]